MQLSFDHSQNEWAFNLGRHLPAWMISSLAGFFLASRWFARRVVVERWFLRCQEPVLIC